MFNRKFLAAIACAAFCAGACDKQETKKSAAADKGEAKKNEAKKNEANKGKAKKSEADKGAAKKDEANKGDAEKNNAKKGGGAAAVVKAAGDKALDKAKGVIAEAKGLTDTKTKALTVAEYERLLLAVEACAIKDASIDRKCPQLKALNDARKARTALKTLSGAMAGLGQKHMTHKSPAVRLKAVSLMGSLFGGSKDTQKVVLEKIGSETHPAVVKAMLKTVGSKGGANPEIGKLLLKMADHAAPMVRKEAISWLSTSFSKTIEGRVDKLMAKMEKDADPKVRAYACEVAGKVGDDKLVESYKKLTADATDKKLYSACMAGLLHTFFSYPFFETNSKKGYELMLQRLGDKPRSDVRPPWTMTDDFQQFASNSKSLNAWKAKASYFKADKVMAVLKDVILDENANWMARTGAVKSYVSLGANKAQLDALVKACAGADGKAKCKNHVVSALEKAAAKAK